MLLLSLSAAAETADQIVGKVLGALNTGSVTARVAITGGGTSTSGTIVLQGRCFKINTTAVKAWYDGTTLWSFSPATDEVNVTEPTADELLTISPYAMVTAYRGAFTATIASRKGSTTTLRFTPKKRSGIKEVTATVSTPGYRITRVVITMTNGTAYTTTISGYTTGKAYAASTFRFSPGEVPKGTPVNDLR